jgi:hypothetical protein
MRSRAARLILSATALIALAAAAFYIFQTEQQLESRRAAARQFAERAIAVERALADVRAGQQAYVAAGQGADFWMPKVAGLAGEAARAVDELRAAAASAEARSALMEAAATIIEIGHVDRRAREYLKADQQLMASDVVFSEGGQTTALASTRVEAARVAEQQALDDSESAVRRQQRYAAGAGALLAGIVIVLVALGATARAGAAAGTPVGSTPAAQSSSALQLHEELPRHSAPAMKAAAELCTDIGRVRDQVDLTNLLGRAAGLMDASGLVVWIGSTGGTDLRPVLAHGYAAETVSRMPPVQRSGDNAAAAAYRTGAMQIVLARPGVSNGALVAPLLTPEGCIGALTAEIKARGETSDTTQALATLFAAQLASVLASSAAMIPAEAPADKIASA